MGFRMPHIHGIVWANDRAVIVNIYLKRKKNNHAQAPIKPYVCSLVLAYLDPIHTNMNFLGMTQPASPS